jgi:hypothetical protein
VIVLKATQPEHARDFAQGMGHSVLVEKRIRN